MQRNHESFYQPYLSDSEDSASITSSDTSDLEEPMKQQQIGSTKFLTQIGGINLNPPEKQLELRVQPRTVGGSRRGVEYSTFDLSGERDPSLPFTGTSFDTASGTYTSILMINSRDRDNQVYPQPTFFTIRLPRTYRNVVSFQITQMKLLSSFFYFRPDKENTTLSVLEQGRTIVKGGQTVDNVITVTIRTGTYNIDTLLAELQTQLNRTPLFFYFPNGFSDFIVQFTAAGDFSVNFNLPGDTYYNSLNDTFVPNPTITQITQQYFATRYAGLSIYTLNQVKVAYYYPVLYEMILDPDFENQLNLTLSPTGPQLLPGETVRSRILYTFQGINDPVILEIIDNNLQILINGTSILDNYRTLHTFVYSLVNEYNCTYETNNNRIVISTTRLNTSLFNLLNNQAAIALADTLNQYGLTLQQYSNLLVSNTLYTSVFTGMYNLIQSNFATYFAVNFGTYSPTFYTNVSNAPFIQNGIDAVGVSKGYSLALLQSGTQAINSSSQDLQSSPGYWPQIVAPPNNTSNQNDTSNNVIFIGAGMGNRIQDLCANFLNLPYNTIAGTMLTNTQMIDNSGNIYISPTFGAGDCVTPIYNSKYTVFRFRSFVRQTLQVETLPLPYYYRYPDVNKYNFSNTTTYPGIVAHFDLSYSFIDSPYLTRTDISNISVSFAQGYSSARSEASNFEFTVRSNIRYYSFQMPRPLSRVDSTPLTDASGYKYPARINFLSVNFAGIPQKYPAAMNFYLYHDQGAFFADISQNRNESPYNYKYTVESSTDLSNAYIDFNAISGNTYYVISRSQGLSFTNTRVRPFVYFPSLSSTPIVRYIYNKFIDPYDSNVPISYPASTDASYNQIYAQYYDPDLIRLPTASNLMGPDPSSQQFNRFLPVRETPIGYDISGISNDLTDYKGYSSNVLGNNPNTAFSVDPITRYTFQNLSGYSSSSNTYFFTGSSNALLAPASNTPYTPKTVSYRQTKIVHWYDTNYLAPQGTQPRIANSNFLARAQVFDASYGALNTYLYDASGNIGTARGGLSLNNGVAAIGFLPSEGTWDLDSFVIKTAYMERPTLAGNFTDPNKQIKTLGIFPNIFVQNYLSSDISSNDALVRLTYSTSKSYTPTEQALTQGFDNTGGTYHIFTKDATFRKTSRYNITGYTPSVTYNFDSNNYYSIVAFDSSGAVVPFYTPMGSYIPYPQVTVPSNVQTYTDSNGTYSLPNCNSLYSNQTASNVGYYIPRNIYTTYQSNLSNFYPQDGSGQIFQSRYQQSIPIKTSLVTSLLESQIVSYSNSMNYYPTNSNPLTTLIPNAYAGWSNPRITEQNNPILWATKGPYQFWLDSEDLLKANLYITSNLESKAVQSNVQFRGNMFLYSNALQSVTRVGDFTPPTISGNPANQNIVIGLTTNNTGTTDTSGVYALVASQWPIQEILIPPDNVYRTYRFSFYISEGNLSYDTIREAWDFKFTRRYAVNSGTPDFYLSLLTALDQRNRVLSNSPIYTSNYIYTKFFFRENFGLRNESKALMFQFAQQDDHDITTYPTSSYNESTRSIWAVMECSGNTCPTVPAISQAVGYDFADLDVANIQRQTGYSNFYINVAAIMSKRGTSSSSTYPVQYYWDNPRRKSDFSSGNLYWPILDWNFTENGLFIANKGILQNQVALSPNPWLQNSQMTSLANEFAGINNSNDAILPTVIQFAPGFRNGGNFQIPVQNQMSSDLCGNLYMQQACIPGIGNIYADSPLSPVGLVDQVWNLNFIGKWVQLTGAKQEYDWIAAGCNATIEKVATVTPSAQKITPTVYDTQFSENASVIPQSIYSTNFKSAPNRNNLFIQICNRQGFFLNQSKITIGDGGTTAVADISGTYGFGLVYTDPNTLSETISQIFSGIPAGATTTAVQNAIIQNLLTQGYTSNSVGIFFSNTPIQIGKNTVEGNNYVLPIYTGNPYTGIQLTSSNVYNKTTGTAIPISATTIGSNDKKSIPIAYPFVRGNKGFGVDTLPYIMSNTWQVFYPTVKIVLRKLESSSTPITNTTDLIGASNNPPGTFDHTAMFFYNNYRDLSNDIFNKFGQENKARFKNFDISSGYGFHSYIYNIQLDRYKGNTRDISANKNYNYLAIRGYSPTEKFNCLTRFYLPGRYDFGFVSLKDLSDETVIVLQELSGSKLVNPNYQTVLNAFNNSFKGKFTFGSNAVAGFNGSNFTFTGWGDFLNTYISIYNTGNSNANLLAQITSNVNQRVSDYIQTYLSQILPSYVLTRTRFTDPLLFSFLFKSSLSDVRKDLEYEWGLGWNLGYPKIDTPFDTIQRATSFYKILDDYIYLKLNQEFWMNRLDSSAPENLSITHEPTGQTNQFAAKLLLANFGSYAQTMVQNPVNFNPVLTAIDRLTFQWVDIAGVQINNFDCEWNAAVQITEQVTTATVNSTIPKAAPVKK